jgi:DNA-binding transcriptional LysR family regulator
VAAGLYVGVGCAMAALEPIRTTKPDNSGRGACSSRHISVVEGWFKSRSVRPKQIIICNSMSTAVKMTAIGMGMTLAPIEVARQELATGTVTAVPVQLELPRNACVTIYPVGQVEPTLAAVIDVMRKLAATLMTPVPVKPVGAMTSSRKERL